jgi:excisionase family DNA binding protein
MSLDDLARPEHGVRYLTVKEAARYLNISCSFLNKARVNGNGPAYTYLGNSVRYTREDLDDFAASRRAHSTSERSG